MITHLRPTWFCAGIKAQPIGLCGAPVAVRALECRDSTFRIRANNLSEGSAFFWTPTCDECLIIWDWCMEQGIGTVGISAVASLVVSGEDREKLHEAVDLYLRITNHVKSKRREAAAIYANPI